MAARWSSSRTIPPWRPTPTGSSDSVTGGSHRTTCSIVRPVPAHERVRLPDGLAGNPRGLAALRLFLRSEEHTSELQSLAYLVCRLLLEKKKHMNYPLH